ncbi:hypothetical protein ANN_14465 [Periplaneta americana]|uniref:Uncharacterized protein n=1 Tax=Periplaneta americana TaxID=6978 RepID=A0ABQ8SWD6_PERAM|nr:hypothetical protein ANN_14465 [Periplaneta americana]
MTETWTSRRSEEKRIEAFEMWIWRRMERMKWTDGIRNEAVLERVGEERIMLKLIRKRKRNWLNHCLRRNCTGRNGEREKRYQMIDDIKIYGSFNFISIAWWVQNTGVHRCEVTVSIPDREAIGQNPGWDKFLVEDFSGVFPQPIKSKY